MNVKHLKYFVTAIELGSYSSAARAAGVTQPTISSAIKSLEKEFGSVLVMPNKDGLELTVAGARLLENSRSLLGDADRIREDMRRIKDLKSGNITIGVREHLLTSMMHKLLDRFSRENPGIGIKVETGDYYELKKMLLGAEIDLIVDHSSGMQASGDVESEFLMGDRLMVFMRPGHPESDKQELPMSIVNGYPHLYSSNLFNTGRHSEVRVRDHGYLDEPPAIDIADINLIANMVANSDSNYMFIWTLQLFETWLKEGKLLAVPVAGNDWSIPIGVSYRSKRLLSHAAQKFIDELHRECQQLTSQDDKAEKAVPELAEA